MLSKKLDFGLADYLSALDVWSSIWEICNFIHFIGLRSLQSGTLGVSDIQRKNCT